jgi:hypothetical protein
MGVRDTVSDAALLMELNRKPLWISVFVQATNFWNRVQKRPGEDIVKIAMQEGCALAAGQRSKYSSWTKDLSRCLQKTMGVDLVPGSIYYQDEVSKGAHELWLTRCDVVCDGKVRDISDRDRKSFRLITFKSWFRVDVEVEQQFWYHLDRPDLIRVMAQFRLGCHWLDCVNDKLRMVPRSGRICHCCNMNDREDEVHLTKCPLYNNLRVRYRVHCDDLDAEDCIRKMMTVAVGDDASDHWYRVAHFLKSAKKCRNDFILDRL